MKFFSALVATLAASASAFAPTKPATFGSRAVALNAASEGTYIDQDRRNLMNLILVGSAAVTGGGLAVPYDLFAKAYLETHPVGDHSLAQGLKGDATYLIVKEDGTLENYGLNAVCTHLGCVVPWSAANNKFMCPCHGSQYAPDGHVVRGPAPLPLALAHYDVAEDDKIIFSPWAENDFRTGGKGWWN